VVIGPDGIEMEKEKMDSVLSWPPPKTVRDMRKFLGLANYTGGLLRTLLESLDQ